MNETLHADILFLHDINYEDGMVRPKLTYEYSDEINIYVGLDIFYGNEDGLFGQFKVSAFLIITNTQPSHKLKFLPPHEENVLTCEDYAARYPLGIHHVHR